MFPIPIDVSAETGLVGSSLRWGLAVLTPQPIVRLGEYKAIWVHDWKYIEIVSVQESLCKVVAGFITFDELFGDVLQSL